LHVAIIMDGNGRWANRRGLPRVAGHRAGVSTVRRIVDHAPAVGVARLTLYAFSSANWNRPRQEVESLFWLMRAYLRLETNRLRQRGVRLEVIGRRDRLPKLLRHQIEQAEFATAEGNCLDLRVAIDYSARAAITRAAVDMASRLARKLPPSPQVLQTMLGKALLANSSDVDLLIRTGGEKRLSDFLLWESAYAELWFTDRMWPDFEASDFDAALQEFSQRQRRFGGLPAQPNPAAPAW
jgi:undecaprenyl diphosphate synthase